jgi:DNA-directed RNA polymerase specialized sigma24 family protein
MTANERSDEELLQLANSGDADAESELTDRLRRSLYDFALRVSLDPVVAASSVRAAFEHHADERPRGLSLTTWYLSLVRDDLLERMRERGRDASPSAAAAPSPVDPIFSTLPPGTRGADDPELAGWVWQAARAQRPRDYSLLDLSVRRGLSADEIAEAADMSHSGIYAILGRLRGFFEEAFAATLLYHRGRDRCPELAALAGSHPALGPAVRREIGRHVEGCAACRQTRRSFPSPADMLAGFVPLEPPPWLTAEEAAAPAGTAAPVEAEPVERAEEEEPAASIMQSALPLDAAAGAVALGAAAATESGYGPSEEPETSPADIEASEAGVEDEIEAPEASLDDEVAATTGTVADVEAGDGAEAAVELEEAGEPGLSGIDLDETIAFAPEAGEAEAVEDEAAFEDIVAADAAGEGEYEDTAGKREMAGAGMPAGAATVAIDAAQDSPVIDDRIRFARDRYLSGMGGGVPPSRPWDRAREWFEGQDRTRMALTALLVGALALAVYLGLALGNSIEGGNGASAGGGLASLPTSTPGVRQIGCGSGPSTVEQGNKIQLDFDTSSLPGYQISSNVGIQPASPQASPQSVIVSVVPPLSVAFEARSIVGSAGRNDEYHLLITFTKQGGPEIHSDCTVIVRGPTATSTASAPTAAPTQAATATSTPRPAATAAPPTAAPPTDTPLPATNTPVPPSPTVPSTSTPTRTPTRTATVGP